MNKISAAILLCTFNGEKYLKEQLLSFEKQSFKNWVLYVSDDGSTDNTKDILIRFQKKWGKDKLLLLNGPKKGFATNFMSLSSNQQIMSDYYAFSDQDDIWKVNKLENAIRCLQKLNNRPALYCSSSELIDSNGVTFGFSRVRPHRINFENSLVESVAGGNTMVFNKKAQILLVKLSQKTVQVISHDWTLYQLITGVGGVIYYDERPSVFYRQHAKNKIGTNRTYLSKLIRLKYFFNGRYKNYLGTNLKAISFMKSQFSPENKIILETFQDFRGKNIMKKLNVIRRGLFQRSSTIETLILYMGSIFKLL